MNNLIQWPTAKYWTAQWNPVIGCKPCSPACENCYAAAWAKRFGQSFEPHETKQRPPRNCDMGTSDEQSERFENFCLKHIGCAEETGGRHCVGCPLEKASRHITQKCELYWSQMPYEPEEGGDR